MPDIDLTSALEAEREEIHRTTEVILAVASEIEQAVDNSVDDRSGQ